MMDDSSSNKKKHNSDSEASSGSDDENDTKTNATKTGKAGQFKRLNYNRPREISSKKPVTKFRNIFQAPRQEFIDPRFSSAMGEYRPEVFRKQYSFVNDMRKRDVDVCCC
jgi:ribosomal RNA-processing protein 36